MERVRSVTAKLGMVAASAGIAVGLAVLGPTGTANADVDNPTQEELLAECRGQDALTGFGVNCTYEVQNHIKTGMEWVGFGDTATNCAGAKDPFEYRIGGAVTVTEQWTVNQGGEVTFGPIKISGSGGYTAGRSVSENQTTIVSVAPNQKKRATLGTSFDYTSGRIRVDAVTAVGESVFRDTYYIENVQNKSPNGYKERGISEAPCSGKVLGEG